MEHPTEKFSILTPVLNCRELIEDCIKSVQEQTYPNWEHIIQDGGSTDGTLDIVKQYAERNSRIKWETKKDRGEAEALNLALGRTSETTSYLLWLNADDRIHNPYVLSSINALFRDWSHISIIYGNSITTGWQNGYDQFGILHIPVNPLSLSTALRWFNGLNTAQPSIYYRIGVLKSGCGFCEDFPHGIDYELMLRTLARGESCRLLNEVLSISRIFRPGAKTGTNRSAELATWTDLMRKYSYEHLDINEQIFLWRDYYIYRINNDKTVYGGAGVNWPTINSEREGFIIALLETQPQILANKQWITNNWRDLIWASEAYVRMGNVEEAKQLYYQGTIKHEEELSCRYQKQNEIYTAKLLGVI